MAPTGAGVSVSERGRPTPGAVGSGAVSSVGAGPLPPMIPPTALKGE
ncbi:MAG: hypothetical protein H0T90_10555 [Gemmatimonadales bacterium]|nr:hypothetical protein [Gemmatimonadales bacterium]